MSIAVFGGVFDPPHLGHVALVQHALARFDFDRVLVVTAGEPPHKQVELPASSRARLAELAFGRMPRVEMSRLELEGKGPHYTVDTLRRVHERHGEPTLLIGADELAGFLGWREPETILELATVAVASRPGTGEEELASVLAALSRPERVSFFRIPAFPLRSREIRELVRSGQAIDQLVPRAVAREIDRLGLYRGRALGGATETTRPTDTLGTSTRDRAPF
ncbi:MAG: nicotinate (nicotinamide) nucleotide adenylyltransferase [Gaiellaceae bacterium]